MLLAAAAGCHEPVTEVVVVLQSDLRVPTETDGILVSVNPGSVAPTAQLSMLATTQVISELAFPLSIGFTSEGTTPNFSITVQLQHGVTQFAPTIVVSRTITDVRFVDQQTMMLVVPFLRTCACMGTSCPSPGDPSCDNIETPVLKPFDPALAPPSTMMPPFTGL